ncbi:hypothetical protein H6G27_36040 [Nostoc linckia FACHB-104]|nr:hypothetical protein [Nostoc linckia FACHB-104]
MNFFDHQHPTEPSTPIAPQPVKPPQPLPTLTTRETARLRDNYPSIEHLEAGNAASWLVERQDQLLYRGQRGRAQMNVAKLITLAGTAVGAVCYATSPLAPIGALIAGVGYVWSVGQDLNDSHCFAPLPFLRGNFFEFLAAMGDSEARIDWFSQKNELADLMFHLDLYERYEFAMLREFNTPLSAYLDQVETGKRFYAYRWLLDRYIDYKGALPDQDSLNQHLASVSLDPQLNYRTVQALQEQQTQRTALPQPKIISLPPPTTVSLPEPPTVNLKDSPSAVTDGTTRRIDTPLSPKQSTPSTPINIDSLLALPLNQRAEQIIKLLHQAGFDLAKCVDRQITVICGNQRGGKGTLMAILAILESALSPDLKVHYFTAGTDLYPFHCDRLICAYSFPEKDEPDKSVAAELYRYLREMDKAAVGAYADRIIVIDEAVALSDYLEAEQKQWMIRFLLSRASKKGAQIFVVLHGQNLTSWVGTGNTSGLSSTFKADVTFIGCESTSKKVGTLRSIAVATGTYFLADPESFATPLPRGEIGTIPAWLKTETNPFTGQPDPARTLLTFFPELTDANHPRHQPILPQDSLNIVERQELTNAIAKVQSSRQAEQSTELSPSARDVLAFFDAVKAQSPKTLRDMKKASRLSGYTDAQIFHALAELVAAGTLIFDGADSWCKADW